jgi:hypothetical protein
VASSAVGAAGAPAGVKLAALDSVPGPALLTARSLTW